MLELLREQPALVVFLLIGLGYVLGRLRVGGVPLGASTGVLLGGLVLGHFGMHGSSGSQSIGFMLFIYCVGLRAGPQFFSAFRENGSKFAALAFTVATVGVAGTVLVSSRLDLPPGYRAELLAGALTSTPTLVAAQDAVRDGMADLPVGFDAEMVLRNIAAAYAITYVVGLFGLLVLVSVLPRLLGIDLKAAARRFADEREAGGSGLAPSAYADMPDLRVYRVTRNPLVGKPFEEMADLRRVGCLVQRVKRDGKVIDLTPQAVMRLGDFVAVLGRRPAQRSAQELLGPESVDNDLLEIEPQTRRILVSGAKGDGRGVATVGTASRSGCAVIAVTRAGMRLPVGTELTLEKGDLVVAVGLPANLDALAQQLGRSERPEGEADLVTFAFGVAAGIALGLISVRVAGVPIGLGTAGGLLLSGLVVGFARTINPTFGQLPVGATSVLMELGLQFFMVNVGLEAGGSVVSALRTTGAWLPLGAFAVMAGPLLVGFAVGRWILGLDPVILLGALTGAMTSTPALDMVNRQADSSLPTVGYAGTYAFANVLLAIAGSLLMRL